MHVVHVCRFGLITVVSFRHQDRAGPLRSADRLHDQTGETPSCTRFTFDPNHRCRTELQRSKVGTLTDQRFIRKPENAA